MIHKTTKPNISDYDDELFDTEAAAKYIGNVKPATLAVWRCIGRYDLKFVKIGKKLVRYRRSELDRFIKESMSP